jgi:CelD/BcsL family acetyltransferase involved in cellulose biosynthesis
MHIVENTVRFVADKRVTDLTGFVYQQGYEADIVQALLSYIKQKGLRADMYPLEHTNPLVHCFADSQNTAAVTEADVNPLLELPASWDDYLALLTGKSRHELRRKMRKGEDVRLETCAPEAIESLLGLMAKDANKQRFLTADMRMFFTSLSARFSKRSWLRLRSARIGNTSVAMLFTFSFHKRIYLYNMGINPSYVHLSPGIVAIALDIRDAITEGKQYYDFLRGDEEYKFRFGARKQHTLRLHA